MLAKSAWVWATCEHPPPRCWKWTGRAWGWSQVTHAPLERWLQRKLQFVNISTSLLQILGLRSTALVLFLVIVIGCGSFICLTDAITFCIEFNYYAVMNQTIDCRSGGHLVFKNFLPL
jgi:hypothetical protein